MGVSRPVQPRWVIQKVDAQTPRLVKELAIRYDMPIAMVVEAAVYQLYKHPERLKGFKSPVWTEHV